MDQTWLSLLVPMAVLGAAIWGGRRAGFLVLAVGAAFLAAGAAGVMANFSAVPALLSFLFSAALVFVGSGYRDARKIARGAQEQLDAREAIFAPFWIRCRTRRWSLMCRAR